jgi:hypothetical protein
LLSIREGNRRLDTPRTVLGGVGVATGIVVLKAGIQILGEPDVEMRGIAFGPQDVDVEEAGVHCVPCPPTFREARNFGAAAFARPWRAEP